MKGRVATRMVMGCVFATLLVALLFGVPFAGRAVPWGSLVSGPQVADVDPVSDGELGEKLGIRDRISTGEASEVTVEQADGTGEDGSAPGIDVDGLAEAIGSDEASVTRQLGSDADPDAGSEAPEIEDVHGVPSDSVQLPNPERERFTDVLIGPQPTLETSQVISEIPLWSSGARLRASYEVVDIDHLRESVARYRRDGEARKAALELSGELALGTSGSLRVGYEVIEEFTELGSFRTNIADAELSYQLGERTRIEAGVGRGVTPDGIEQSAGLDLSYRLAPNTSILAGIKMLSFGDAQNVAEYRESLAEARLQLRF